MRRAVRVCALGAAITAALGAGACGPPQRPLPPPLGILAVSARDHDTRDPIAHADLELRAGRVHEHATTDASGAAAFFDLAPGVYDLVGTFAGQPIEIDAINVRARDTSYADLVFTLGHDAVKESLGDPHTFAIDVYHPRGLAPTAGRVEGTVIDSTTLERVAGAVVFAVRDLGGGQLDTLEAPTDDAGRYHFDGLVPGVYVVSVSYSLGGRGSIEARRSDIHVDGGTASVVPLAVELTKRE